VVKNVIQKHAEESGVKNTNALSTAEDPKGSVKNNIANMEENKIKYITEFSKKSLFFFFYKIE
jgi:hypothetical protein